VKPLSVLSLFRYFGFLNSFQYVLHILVYMSKFVGSGEGALKFLLARNYNLP